MCLSETLLNNCNEFLDDIANENKNEELTNAIDSLRHFLESDMDGLEQNTDDELVLAVQSRLDEIYELISTEEKCANHLLTSHYEELMEYLEIIQERIEMNESLD